jgi:hypothetical protein
MRFHLPIFYIRLQFSIYSKPDLVTIIDWRKEYSRLRQRLSNFGEWDEFPFRSCCVTWHEKTIYVSSQSSSDPILIKSDGPGLFETVRLSARARWLDVSEDGSHLVAACEDRYFPLSFTRIFHSLDHR